MRVAFLIAGALALGASPPAVTQAEPVVVELYTSQGCSSCPAADEFLGELAENEDVIALSLHVDYWDYLGWKDQFARPEHTRRQDLYREISGSRSVYTPQMVVQGSDLLVGSRRAQVMSAIEGRLAKPAQCTIKLNARGDRLEVTIAPVGDAMTKPGRVWLVGYDKAQQVAVKRGENRGRTLTYHNVVRSWMPFGEWRGETQSYSAPLPMTNGGVAVIVQSGETGPIMGAAQLKF